VSCKAIAKIATTAKIAEIEKQNLETRRKGVNGGKPLPEQEGKLVFDSIPCRFGKC